MTHALTLVGPDAKTLAPYVVSEIAGATAVTLDACAFDILVGIPSLPSALAAKIASARVDAFFQPVAARQKQALLADLESTLVENEFLDDIAARMGVQAQVQAITAQGMAGQMDFQQAVQARLQLLRGTPRAVLQQALDGWRPSAGLHALLAMLQRAAIPVWVVSSGFDFFVAPLAATLGCHTYQHNALVWQQDVLAGTAQLPIKDRHTKRAAVDDVAAQQGCTPAALAAIGDGANDVPMLQAVGSGFGFRAKPVVAAACRFNILHSDLRAVAFAFGLKNN